MPVEPANYAIVDDCVLTTYGKQPCPHCYDRREFGGRVFWTMPRAIVLALAGIQMAVCASCIAENEAYGDVLHFEGEERFPSLKGEHNEPIEA